MKKIVNTLFALLIMGMMVTFAIGYIFSGSIAGGNGIFEGIGSILDSVSSNKTRTLPTMDNSLSSGTAPILKYSSVPYSIGSCVTFKSLFTVITDNGEKNGSEEDDFKIYLSDIRSHTDNSVVQFVTTEQIITMEEIPAPFLYDTQTDMLYCFESGIYTVYVKIYGNNGTYAEYEFLMPIEIN